ncbi:MAG: hypothetical protein ACE5I1_07590 [bacterium]
MRYFKKDPGPLVAGLLIDLIDFATFGPLGNGKILRGLASMRLDHIQRICSRPKGTTFLDSFMAPKRKHGQQ